MLLNYICKSMPPAPEDAEDEQGGVLARELEGHQMSYMFCVKRSSFIKQTRPISLPHTAGARCSSTIYCPVKHGKELSHGKDIKANDGC